MFILKCLGGNYLDYQLLYLSIYLIFINIVAVVITIADKIKAEHNRWRIKEATLLIISALGGSVGMYITMKIIRHKTKKTKFMIGIPVIFIAEVFAVVLIAYLLSKV